MTETTYKKIVTAFDMEMNQPSGKIISIGAVQGDLISGTILKEDQWFVKIDEKLNTSLSATNIPKLTGITDELLQEKGISLPDAYYRLADFHKGADILNPIVWGHGDSKTLKKQLEEVGFQFSEGFENKDKLPVYCFGRREFDVKQRFQEQCILEGVGLQSGLKKSKGRCGLTFKGKAHDAMSDARNTFLFYHYLLFQHIPGTIRQNKSRRSR